ncbi:hypothetical protein [Streptomyces sp. LN245]|uniref:hypothetical protein n=1 Tax=Streptomyces sp. LN245 TaxID=3112975 RepID=UPI0037138C80
MEDTALDNYWDADVRFGTERIGAYPLLPSQDPAQRDADRSAPNPWVVDRNHGQLCGV